MDNRVCLACGSEDLAYANSYGNILLEEQIDNVTSVSLKTVVTICRKCSLVQMYAIKFEEK